MSDKKDVSAEAIGGGSIYIKGRRIWKVVTVVRSLDDRQFVV